MVPEHDNEYVVSWAIGPTLCEPLVALVPLQPPVAVQVVTLELDQVSVELPFFATPGGLAVRLTVGEAIMATFADTVTLPPVPLHMSV